MLYRQRKIGGAPWWLVGGWNNFFADGEVCEADITHRLAGPLLRVAEAAEELTVYLRRARVLRIAQS